MQAVYDCSSFPRTIPWNDHVFATKLTAGCDWKTRIWSATTFECLHEPGWGGSGVHMFSFKYQKNLWNFAWSTFHYWVQLWNTNFGQLEELEHSGQVLSSAFSADGSFVGVNPGCFQGGWRMKIPWIFSAFFAWIQGCNPLCRSYGLGLAGFHWWIGLKPRNIYHEMLGNETLPLNGRWWIWKICKWFHWGSQIRRPFRSCAILSSLLTDFFESANWYACIDSGQRFVFTYTWASCTNCSTVCLAQCKPVLTFLNVSWIAVVARHH